MFKKKLSRGWVALLASLLAGCSAFSTHQNHPSSRDVYQADSATELEIASLVEAVEKTISEKGSLTFTDIYTVRRKDNGKLEVGCGVVKHEEWPAGEQKSIHLTKHGVSLLDGAAFRGACDPSKYSISPNYVLSEDFVLAESDRSTQSQTDELVATEIADHTLRERVEITQQQESFAKNIISEMLKDPDSAKFRRMYGAKGSVEKIAICGEFNAKNSYGGYTGYKPFMVFEGGDRGFVWDSNTDEYSFDNMMIEETCPTE